MSEERKSASKFTLEEFPGYTCYLFQPDNYRVTFQQSAFDGRNVKLRYGHKYWFYAYQSECCILPSKFTTVSRYSSGVVFDDDVLLVHPDSKIPRTIISKGTVFNERGASVPSKIVIPDNYPNCLFNKHKYNGNVLLFVNHDAKLVFVVESYTSESSIGGSLQQWKSAFYDSPDIFESFSEFVDGFTMPYGVKLFMIAEGLTALDKALIWNMIPELCTVHELNVTTGDEELTVDMLYSAYMMLQSPDDQIVETAFNMLARSKFLPVKYVIRWLLKGNRQALYYRQKSTAFKWLYSQCCEHTSSLFLPDDTHKNTARELVRRITGGGIDYTEQGNMTVNDPKWLQDDRVRLLASKI